MREAVIEKETGKLLRWGYCDFTTQLDFDTAKEEVVETGQELDSDYEWTWDGKSFVKGELIDKTASGVLLKDVVTGSHYIVEVESGVLKARPA